MTNNNSENRLDRIERAIESNTRNIAETRAAIAETKKIVESNSRAIQGMLEQRATDRLEHEERMRRLEETIREQQAMNRRLISIQDGLGRMLASIDDDRPTILRKLNTIETKLDRIIESK